MEVFLPILSVLWLTHLSITLALWRRVIDLKDERYRLNRRVDRLESEMHAAERSARQHPPS